MKRTEGSHLAAAARARLSPVRRLRLQSVAVALTVASPAASAGADPVLHEYVDLGPGSGTIAPAVTGQLGARPPARDGAEPPGSSVGEGSSAGGSPQLDPEASFSIDRDTSRPERVGYSDPFTPTVVPFKRAIVYDGVDRQGDLIVRDTALSDVQTVSAPRPNDESFHASFELELRAGERVPIPSVAPGARLVLVSREPRVPLRIATDSAENWYVTSSASRHVRLALQIVADRRVFGSSFPDVSASALAPALPALPDEVKQSALEVARALGIADAARPRQVVMRLVDHFRRFAASDRRPNSQGLSLYRELALTARGICRHRAYAFMITALGLGVPARMALNEAHAWVEVFDGELWHRIDLGGAADELDTDDEGRPRHVEPRDPFAWPDRRESGLALAERSAARAAQGSGAPEPAGGGAEPPPPEAEPPGSEPREAAQQSSAAPAEPSPSPAPSAEVPGADVEVALRAVAERAERGKSLSVSGVVQSSGRVCSGARIDVLLVRPEGPSLPLGSLVSDVRGEFRGSLVIPWNTALGEHTLLATASGCAPRGPGVR